MRRGDVRRGGATPGRRRLECANRAREAGESYRIFDCVRVRVVLRRLDDAQRLGRGAKQRKAHRETHSGRVPSRARVEQGDEHHGRQKNTPRRPTSETSRPPRARRPSGGGWRHAREAPRRECGGVHRHVSLKKRARACAGFVGHSKQPSSASDLPRRERVRSARPGPGDARVDDASRRRSQPLRFRSAPRARPYPSFTDHFARRVFAAPPRTVPLALAMRATWTKLVNMVIRPPRAQYDPSECLPGPRFRIGGVAYRRVDVDLEGALGHLLRCSLYEPEIRGADPSPCVIYLHGNSGSRCDAVDAVRLLLPAGISVFALDLGGSGISEGEHVTLGVRETLDVAVVVAHLRRGGRVDRVGIWGRSMGAVTALLYANRDPSIAGIVLDSPFSSLTGLMSELVDDYFSASYVAAPRARRDWRSVGCEAPSKRAPGSTYTTWTCFER